MKSFFRLIFILTSLRAIIIVDLFRLVTRPLEPISNGISFVFQPAFSKSFLRSLYLVLLYVFADSMFVS